VQCIVIVPDANVATRSPSLLTYATFVVQVRVEASRIIPDEALCGYFLHGEFQAEKQIRYKETAT